MDILSADRDLVNTRSTACLRSCLWLAFTLSLLTFVALVQTSAARNPVVCHSVSDAGGTAAGDLLVFDPETDDWTKVEPIASNPDSQTLYAIDGDVLTQINTATAAFTPLGTTRTADRPTAPTINTEYIGGLTLALTTQLLWASERRPDIQAPLENQPTSLLRLR